jgi:hypothetical protein
MSRRGLIIRLLIFVPLFAYFGYGAYQKWSAERAYDAEPGAPSNSRKMTLPDGRSIDVIELTPEQAEQQYGIKLPPEGEKKKPVEVTPAVPVAPATVSDGDKPVPATPAAPAEGVKPAAPAEPAAKAP